MEITYNGLSDINNLLTFSDVPNILKVKETIVGTNTSIIFTFTDGASNLVSKDEQYYVKLFGETVSNVLNPTNAVNKSFCMFSDAASTASSFANALRNCGSIAVNYHIIHKGSVVSLFSKTIGNKIAQFGSGYYTTNIPNAYLQMTLTDGTVYSDFYNSKVSVDVYSGNTITDEMYVTTLQKNYYGNECAFNMTPVLGVFSEYGKNTPYILSVSMTKSNGKYQYLGNVSGSTTCGYIVDDSNRYLINSSVQILLNKNENKKIYIYNNVIKYSVLCSSDTGGWLRQLTCYDSANNEVYSITNTQRRTSSNNIIDLSYTIPSHMLSLTSYIDITESIDTVRLYVIKPLKASGTCERVYWRNEYGGISFFDFTSKQSESESIGISTYEKNIFDYYDNDEVEFTKIYDNEYEKEIKLTSHLMEKEGKWIFNSLFKSKRIWVEKDGKKKYIIPKSMEITENENYSGIYSAKFTYVYSDYK